MMMPLRGSEAKKKVRKENQAKIEIQSTREIKNIRKNIIRIISIDIKMIGKRIIQDMIIKEDTQKRNRIEYAIIILIKQFNLYTDIDILRLFIYIF